MKRITHLLFILLIPLVLSACNDALPPPSEPNPLPSPTPNPPEPDPPSPNPPSPNPPSPNPSPTPNPNPEPPSSEPPPDPNQLPFTGTITLDEYDWFGINNFLGVIDIELPVGEKKRLLNGRRPWRHPSGKVVFLQGCGDRVSRVALADTQGLITPITPCSSEIENPGYSPTDFDFSRLSPDEQKLAVEVYYYLGSGYRYYTVVFDRQGNALASFEDVYAPAWLPDGRLLLTGEGFYLTDVNLKNLTRIDGGKLNGVVNNPDVHPSGESIVFEYNQQIWVMNIDGSGLKELVYGSKRLRYPTWSPDGKSIVYLGLEQEDYYDRALYFTNLLEGKSYALDLSSVLVNDSSVVPNGPLSWTK